MPAMCRIMARHDDAPGLRTLTLREAAQRLIASPGFVAKLAREGDLPACKVGRGWVFRESDVARYLDNRITAAQAARRIIANKPGRARRKLPALV